MGSSETRCPLQACAGWEPGSPLPTRVLGDAAFCWPLTGQEASGSPLPSLHLPPSASLPRHQLWVQPHPRGARAPPLSLRAASFPPRPVSTAPPPTLTTKGRARLSTAALAGGGSVTDGVVWSACEMALVTSVRHILQPRSLGAPPSRSVPRPERPEPCAHLGVVQEPAVQHAAQRGDADGHHAGLGGCAGQGVVAHSLPDVAGETHSERTGQDPGSCGHRGP